VALGRRLAAVPTLMSKRLSWVALLLAQMGCASTDTLLASGRRELAAGQWQAAREDFAGVVNDACTSEPKGKQCLEGRVGAAECQIRLGDPKGAYFALEEARQLGPLDASVDADLGRVQTAAQDAFARGGARPGGHASLSVAFVSQADPRLALDFARFFLDLHPIPTDNRPYLPGTTVLPVPPTDVPAGHHELEVLATFNGVGRYSGYRFNARSSQPVVLAAGTSTGILVQIRNRPVLAPAETIVVDFAVSDGAVAPEVAPSR
jgi:hypothetical protein